jgi:hypothetical protein
VTYTPRPWARGATRACSFRHPLCVNAGGVNAGGADRGGGASPGGAQRNGQTLAWLDAAERAWDIATGSLDLPPPDPSPTTDALDLYIVDGAPYATRTLLDARDPRAGFDRASAFALVSGSRDTLPGCALDAAAARVIARAIAFRVAPATDETSALAESAYLASLMVPCAPRLDAGLRAFQERPGLGLAETLGPPDDAIDLAWARAKPGWFLAPTPGELYAQGASLFYDWVDDSFGGYPGAIVRAIWAMSPTVTPPGASRWNDEPDGFDVLRTSFKNALTTGSTVDDLWLDFAAARAFVPGYPVRLDWQVDWPRTPRSLTSGAGVSPTGGVFVDVNCAGRPPGARLRVEIRWEEHARILWALARVDASGNELSRVAVPGPDRGTEAQTTLVDLDGVARVLVIGASAGEPLYPFDPDDYAWEPHGWVVSLAGVDP